MEKEIEVPDVYHLTIRETNEFVDFGINCPLKKKNVTKDDRMNAVNESLAYNILFTLAQHKDHFRKTFNEVINENTKATHEGGFMERVSKKSNHTRDKKKKEDKHYPSQLAEQNKKSKDKQRDNNTDSYIKSKDDKVALRVAFNIIRNDPGTIVCLLSENRCPRSSHKNSYNHLFCPKSEKFNMLDGKCFWNPDYGL
jgi:hypothetical protein